MLVEQIILPLLRDRAVGSFTDDTARLQASRQRRPARDHAAQMRAADPAVGLLGLEDIRPR
jgi:hypothetical protein